MAKLTLTDITSLANTASAKQALNDNFTAIEAAVENTLSRDGAAPNQMEADIDLNGNDLLNVKRIDADEIYKNGVPFEQTVAYANKNFQLLSGTGAQTVFILNADPGSLGNLYVSVGGLDLKPGIDYNYSGTTLSFAVAPASGTDNIYVRYDQALPTGVTAAGAVTFSQQGAGSAVRTLQDKGYEYITVEDKGALGDGVSLDNAAFAAAALLGKVVHLKAGATYYLSQRVDHVTGTRFICDGVCTIKLKTGAGGYNHTNLNTSKDANAVFYMSGVDDVGVEGVRFTTDGVKEVCIYPIRINGGCTVKGADVHRIEFNGLSALGGGYFSKNSIGAGGVRFSDIRAVNCGTAQGNTYWTGTPQITVVEVDNDLVGGVHSNGNAIHGRNVGALGVLLTGTALTHYGQQTDCVNVAGISASQRKGPTITDIWADGVGEVLDVFCSYGSFQISRARNVHNFVVKAVHGAQGNSIEVDNIESCGLAAVTVAGSASATVHTTHNVIHVRNCFGVGDSGTGPSSTDTCAVLIQENGGAIGTCLPRNNLITIDNFVPGANTDYAVKDNCSVNNANGNLVIFDRAPTGMGTAFGTVNQEANIQVVVKDRARIEACLSAAQNGLTTATDTTVAFAEVITDRQSQFNTGTNTARMKYPGEYEVRVSVRTLRDASDNVVTKIFKNAAAICQTASEPVSGGLEYTYIATKTTTIGVNDAGTAAADLLAKVNITSGSAINLLDTNSMTFFEVNPVS